MDEQTNELVISIHFQLSGSQANSLLEAPFGSFEFYRPVDSVTTKQFIRFVIESLRKTRITQLIIKSAPAFYYAPTHSYEELLKSTFGFSVIQNDINHHLMVINQKLADQMHPMQRRRLQKCADADFQCVNLPLSELPDIYRFISKCRADKAHALSISLQKMESLTRDLPDSYLLFACYDQEQLIAASVCVVVNAQVLYHFLPASDAVYNHYSPMVFLTSHIFAYCKCHGFEVLDLGTSMLGDSPNEKLIQFKKRMGGIESHRSILKLDL